MLQLILHLFKSSTSHTSLTLPTTISSLHLHLPPLARTSLTISLSILLLPFLLLILLYASMCIRNQLSGTSRVINSLPRPPRYPVIGHLGEYFQTVTLNCGYDFFLSREHDLCSATPVPYTIQLYW
jgi:hypothetical protein